MISLGYRAKGKEGRMGQRGKDMRKEGWKEGAEEETGPCVLEQGGRKEGRNSEKEGGRKGGRGRIK